MKWIKSRQEWLNEAKIRDVILPRQAKQVSSEWGEKYLDYEEIEPTEKINQGRWKLEEEDKIKVLSAFFDCDMGQVMSIFSSLPDKFNHVAQESIKLDILGEAAKVVMDGFNAQSPTVDQIVFIYEPVFRKLEIRETQADSRIQKDEAGRPVRDEEGNMVRINKNPGDPVFSNNLVNINTFVDDFNRCYTDSQIDTSGFSSRGISQLRNLAKENHNSDYKYEYSIFGKDIYLQIDHNPQDILNMSISKFYSSCQHLYSGGYRTQLLGNVFDPNSIPAFLVFDTPILWNGEKISDKLPLSRMMIRNIASFEQDVENPFDTESIDDSEVEKVEKEKEQPKIFFDRAYPDRMKNIFDQIVPKYSKNEQNVRQDEVTYIFSPDVDTEDSLSTPYMDRLRSREAKFIGVNTKSLYLSRYYDWSKVFISPKAKIQQLVIETTDIPQNLTEIPLDLEWVKFKGLKIKTLSGFENIKTDQISFDKCKFDTQIFRDMLIVNPNIKKLQLVSCDITGDLNIKDFEQLEELQVIFTLDSVDELVSGIEGSKIKKLDISSDMLMDGNSKDVVSNIRRSGIKVEVVGPKI